MKTPTCSKQRTMPKAGQQWDTKRQSARPKIDLSVDPGTPCKAAVTQRYAYGNVKAHLAEERRGRVGNNASTDRRFYPVTKWSDPSVKHEKPQDEAPVERFSKPANKCSFYPSVGPPYSNCEETDKHSVRKGRRTIYRLGNRVHICPVHKLQACSNLPRNCWPKGRFVSTVVAKDGQVRQATVQTVNSTYIRPAHKLAKLDVGMENNNQREQGICTETN
uniref:Uncharacterized protein n=1 Tax=Anopheles arabiensis TaxID=7173 RepID=A0A182HFL9_ANOAR